MSCSWLILSIFSIEALNWSLAASIVLFSQYGKELAARKSAVLASYVKISCPPKERVQHRFEYVRTPEFNGSMIS